MALYKGIELDNNLCRVIRYMSGVDEYREALQGLQGMWDNLTLLGQLSGTGTDMSATRQAFHQLTVGLLNNLGNESQKKIVLEMKSKAQVAVDIMIRNLFERTADIGFLATDDEIREYAARAPGYIKQIKQGFGSEKERLQEEFGALTTLLQERFREYAQKYSVYSNIILLDCAGNVLIQLDPANPVEHSGDTLILESLQTGREYVETFHHSDLMPEEARSLIYSYRVISPDDGSPLGVLCLCFRFYDESEGIFANLRERDDDWGIITLLDGEGRVIASSDEWHIPIGAAMELVLDADCRVVRFAGREYLATTRPTKGYQGYTGLGWHGHVMMPLEHAFGKDASDMLKRVADDVLADVMSNPSLFSEDLRNIPLQADRIQCELNRSVWNGNVRQSSDKKAINPAFSKILLWEISNTGLKTKDVFERSIGNLHQTVVTSILQDSQFLAALAIDIMDRNLYERANDCRWWALRSCFREQLGKGELGEDELRAIQTVLAHINSLYTVYDNLVLFDGQGRILAVSNPACQSFQGRVLSDDWVRNTLALKNSQSYTVSAFEPAALYKNRHTYIYGAAIHEGEKAVGGIGIVFDAEPQFEAMLKDALPRDEKGEPIPGSFGVFADQERCVIASTHQDVRPGQRIAVDEKFFALGNGQGISNIIEYGGHYYAVGSRMSSGYREYKGPLDGYRNDVVALIFVPLCPARTEHAKAREAERPRLQLQVGRSTEFGDRVEIATFYVGGNWFGLHSEDVVEAIGMNGLTPVPGAASYLMGCILYEKTPIPVVDIRQILPDSGDFKTSPSRQIVVVRVNENDLFGILVDSLGEIPEVAHHRIEALSPMFSGEGAIADSVVKPEPTQPAGELLLVLSPEKICQRIAAKSREANQARKGNAGTAIMPPAAAKRNVTEMRPHG